LDIYLRSGHGVPENTDGFNETQSFKEIQKEAKSLSKWFENIAKIKTSDPQALVQLDKALQTLPDDAEFIHLYQAYKDKVRSFITTARQNRANNIKRLISAYIRDKQQSGQAIREFVKGWRIGPLELQIDFDQAMISFRYNQEILTKWQSVGSVEDIQKAEVAALTLLEKAALPPDLLTRVFWEAYLEARKRNSRSLDQSLVAINEFYREVRIALVRSRFETKKPHVKLDRFVEFPKYAFLYNLDLYRAMTSQIPAEIKLAWQTGSMREVNKGNGVVVNGLNAANEYKFICYVKQAQEGN
jgi:hypothetical protein